MVGGDQGVRVSHATMSRVITRHFGWTRKKSLRARERNEAKRAAWRERTRGIDPARFVWIDETGSHLGMTRPHSRAPRGQRAYGTAPSSRGKNRTLITALTLEGFGPGLLLDEAIDYDTFDGYIIHRLAPTLKPGQIVVVDNLKVHYSDRARAAIEARGAQLWYLPPYSPDLNPIEEAFSKVKTFLRTAEPRTARGPQHRHLGRPQDHHPAGCRRLVRPRRLRPPPTTPQPLSTAATRPTTSTHAPRRPAHHHASPSRPHSLFDHLW